jgi:hypothetical protein
MVHTSLSSLETAIRAGWSVWTSDPVDQPAWSKSNPASGQCASTALVVQDLIGGELLMAEVRSADGAPHGVHYWNRLAGGLELDLTREQFRDGEVVREPRQTPRPLDVTRGRLPGHYQLLAARVARELASAGSPDGARDANCVRRQGLRSRWTACWGSVPSRSFKDPGSMSWPTNAYYLRAWCPPRSTPATNTYLLHSSIRARV